MTNADQPAGAPVPASDQAPPVAAGPPGLPVPASPPGPAGPPAPDRRRLLLALVAGAVVLLLALAGGYWWLGRGGGVLPSLDSSAKAGDVRLTSCRAAAGAAEVGYTVTNRGTETRGYAVTIEVLDRSERRIADQVAVVSGIEAGQQASGSTVVPLAGRDPARIACRIAKVS